MNRIEDTFVFLESGGDLFFPIAIFEAKDSVVKKEFAKKEEFAAVIKIGSKNERIKTVQILLTDFSKDKFREISSSAVPEKTKKRLMEYIISNEFRDEMEQWLMVAIAILGHPYLK